MAVRRKYFSVHLLDTFDTKPGCTLGQQLPGGEKYFNGTHINLVEGTIQISSLEEMYGGFKKFIAKTLYPLWSYQSN